MVEEAVASKMDELVERCGRLVEATHDANLRGAAEVIKALWEENKALRKPEPLVQQLDEALDRWLAAKLLFEEFMDQMNGPREVQIAAGRRAGKTVWGIQLTRMMYTLGEQVDECQMALENLMVGNRDRVRAYLATRPIPGRLPYAGLAMDGLPTVYESLVQKGHKESDAAWEALAALFQPSEGAAPSDE